MGEGCSISWCTGADMLSWRSHSTCEESGRLNGPVVEEDEIGRTLEVEMSSGFGCTSSRMGFMMRGCGIGRR